MSIWMIGLYAFVATFVLLCAYGLGCHIAASIKRWDSCNCDKLWHHNNTYHLYSGESHPMCKWSGHLTDT